MVSEAGGKAVRVEEKDGLGVLPEASRPQGLFFPAVPGGLEAGSKALLPRAWVHFGFPPPSADGGKTGGMSTYLSVTMRHACPTYFFKHCFYTI